MPFMYFLTGKNSSVKVIKLDRSVGKEHTWVSEESAEWLSSCINRGKILSEEMDDGIVPAYKEKEEKLSPLA